MEPVPFSHIERPVLGSKVSLVTHSKKSKNDTKYV